MTNITDTSNNLCLVKVTNLIWKAKFHTNPCRHPVVSLQSLARSLEGRSSQNLIQSTPDQARAGGSPITRAKTLTLDMFLGHKGRPRRGPGLPELPSCHPQVSVPPQHDKDPRARFSSPGPQGCSAPMPRLEGLPRQMAGKSTKAAGPGLLPRASVFSQVKQGLRQRG